MKYIIKNGAFVCKEDGSTKPSIEGTLTGIRSITSESGAESIQLDLAGTDDEGNPVTRTISVRKYGDASLKILRCLFGIADIITGVFLVFEDEFNVGDIIEFNGFRGTVTSIGVRVTSIRDAGADISAGKRLAVSIEPREGHGALITVTADGEALEPAGTVEPYAADKKAMTVRMLGALRDVFGYGLTLTVFGNKDGYLPMEDGVFDAEAAAAYIRELRIAGRGNELVVKRTTFTNRKAAAGYLQAFRDASAVSRCVILPEGEAATLVNEAWEEELPSADGTDENGREQEY